MRAVQRVAEMSRKSLVFFLPFLCVLGVVFHYIRRAGGSASPQEAYDIMTRDSTVVLLDVRSRNEFAGELGHLRGAVLIPVEELEQRAGELEEVKNRLLIAYCRSGRRSRNAATLLVGKGFRVLNLEGGILSWNRERLPVVRDVRP